MGDYDRGLKDGSGLWFGFLSGILSGAALTGSIPPFQFLVIEAFVVMAYVGLMGAIFNRTNFEEPT
jgi:hypothetical protein